MSGGTAVHGNSLNNETLRRLINNTYYMACFHVSPSRLLTAAAILKTSDANQKPFTAFAVGDPREAKEYCKQVAVTAEKKVAIVDKFNKFIAACFCAKRIVGTPDTVENEDNGKVDRISTCQLQ
jgi:hypothetical protein